VLTVSPAGTFTVIVINHRSLGAVLIFSRENAKQPRRTN